MTLNEKIYTAVKALVANRAFPGSAPENTARPLISFVETASEDSRTLSGSTGLRKVALQLNVYDDSAKPLADFDALCKATAAALRSIGAFNVTSGREDSVAIQLRGTSFSFEIWHRD